MKRDLIFIVAYLAFLIALYELNSKHMEKQEKRAIDFEEEIVNIAKNIEKKLNVPTS